MMLLGELDLYINSCYDRGMGWAKGKIKVQIQAETGNGVVDI